ncbi:MULTISPECIES: tetratricopeptide repeat protein [unclassified Crossiella]|uniref:tetratricopeptide repeat protein n=1 Tax=unclassified Crossiella TaxID=2620835 RepID=UPI001FFF2700|nr:MULTISPECIES: tetratricopeptide repeat protein [unclassified Crossiella]MCK2239229.1 tetratricopeptide repeat protein [Crossiella sp. S99.2]MCK2251202.1 tetratricopeptide repeat protein [Crossiella sp. S99.1]
MQGRQERPGTENSVYGTVHGTVVQARSIDLRLPPPPIPRQLPSPAANFTGRAPELATLDDLLTRSAPVLVTGTAGVGKTTLALRWSHQHGAEFSDGQLYANLHGFDLDDTKIAPADVLERFLLALGLAPEAMPASLDGRAAEFRTRTADRRVLVLLDNVGTAAQVRPLLPAGPHSRVLLTSRIRLLGLDAEHLSLGMFSPDEAISLLREVIAGRVDRDRATAMRITEQCARLPLALCIAAERIRHREHDTLADLAAELDEQPLDALALAGDEYLAVGPAIALSYRALPPASARMFRLLGVHRCADLSAGAAAALAGMTAAETRVALSELVSSHLLEEFRRNRYRCHDLLRAFARRQAEQVDLSEERAAAVVRLVRWYAAMADQADHLLAPHRPRGHPDLRIGYPTEFVDQVQARSWCELELESIVSCLAQACELGRPDLAWQTIAALHGFLSLTKHESSWIRTHDLGQFAAAEDRSTMGLALMHYGLGSACRYWQNHWRAISYGDLALGEFQRVGDRRLQGMVLSNLAMSYFYVGRPRHALGCLRRSLVRVRECGDRHTEAWVLCNLGSIRRWQGKSQRALEQLRAALEIRIEIGDLDGEAWTHDELGCLYHDLGRRSDAEAAFRRAIELHGLRGNLYGRKRALARLAEHLEDDADSGWPAAQ